MASEVLRGTIPYPLEAECCGQKFATGKEKEFVAHWEWHGWNECLVKCRYCESIGTGVSLKNRINGRKAHLKSCPARPAQTDASMSPSNSPLATQTQAQSIDTAYRCQHCAYSTSTKTGLSLHVKAKHPVDFNQERLVQHELNKKNTVWSEDALRVMASTEVELKYLGGSIHINIEIEKKLTAAGWKHGFASKEKRQEAIRKKRQSEAY